MQGKETESKGAGMTTQEMCDGVAAAAAGMAAAAEGEAAGESWVAFPTAEFEQTMKGFPKVLKTKEDYYNCLAMVASGELAAADLLAKIESAENQRYIECGVATVEEEKKAVTVYYCDEAAVGMKFVAGDVSGTVQGVTHIQTDEAAAAGEAGNDRTALTLSKAVKAGCKVIALERTDTVAGMTTDDIAALKGVLKQYE